MPTPSIAKGPSSRRGRWGVVDLSDRNRARRSSRGWRRRRRTHSYRRFRVSCSDLDADEGPPCLRVSAVDDETGQRSHVDRPSRRISTRRAIADLMSRSKREIPHYYLSQEVNLTATMRWLTDTNAGRPANQRLLPASLILKAAALAVSDVPELNGFWVDGGFRPAPSIHLGVAIAQRGGGLMAPCIHDTHTLSVDEVMSRLRDLVARTRVRRAAILGNERSDVHGHEPRRSRCADRLRRRFIHRRSPCSASVRSPSGRGLRRRDARRPTRGDRDLERRPPSNRRTRRRPAAPPNQ